MSGNPSEQAPPGPVIHNRVNLAYHDREGPCQFGERTSTTVRGANDADLPSGQPRVRATFTRALPALREHVSRVVGLRAEKEMRRPNAGPIVAVMQYEHAGRDRTIRVFPGDPMSHEPGAAGPRPDRPVAGRQLASGPFPTRIATTLANPAPQPFRNGRLRLRVVPTTLGTETSCHRRRTTVLDPAVLAVHWMSSVTEYI